MFFNQINKIFAFFLLCLSFSLFTNCTNSQSNSVVSSNSVSTSNEKPVIIQAADLLKEYRENPSAADGKYKGKLLAVSGKVAGSFGSGDDGALWIGINSEGLTNLSDPDPKEIECGNGDIKKAFKEKIELDQEVTLVGINQGIQTGITNQTIKNILLKNCRIESKSFSDNSKKDVKSENFVNASSTEIIPSETPLPDASKGMLPSDEEMNALLQKTIKDLADAIEAEDFTKFKTTVSKGAISYNVPPERLKMFYGHQMMLPRLRKIVGTKPTFSRKPSIDKYTLTRADKTKEVFPALNLSGVYENTDSPVKFEVQYLAEGKDWKVSVFNFTPK